MSVPAERHRAWELRVMRHTSADVALAARHAWADSVGLTRRAGRAAARTLVPAAAASVLVVAGAVAGPGVLGTGRPTTAGAIGSRPPAPLDPPPGVSWLVQPPARIACLPIVAHYEATDEPYPARDEIANALLLVEQALHRSILWTDAPDGNEVSLDVRWVPSPDHLPNPGGRDAVGEGGPDVASDRIVGGHVWLVADTSLSRGRSPGSTEAVLVHEVGHALLGLGHSDDPRDAMYPTMSPGRTPGFSSAEVAAAAWVGAGCRSTPVGRSTSPRTASLPQQPATGGQLTRKDSDRWIKAVTNQTGENPCRTHH